MNKIKKWLLDFLTKLGLNKKFIANYFKTDYEKNALICYITFPFNFWVSHNHSNMIEAKEIAKIFSELKYNVDIIQHDCSLEDISFSTYEIIFGMEPNFEMLVTRLKPKRSIYYATGANYTFQNSAELGRIRDFKARHGVELQPRRQVLPNNSLKVADAIICIGNDWTKSTYAKDFSKDIETIRVSTYDFFPAPQIAKAKDWDKARSNFLWFGSVGAIHKGLDLLIDVFDHHPELNLYVCGNVVQESDFYNYYKEKLTSRPNIIFEGWVKPRSAHYRELVTRCGFTVLPTCSEGMNGSVLTNMRSGLVPIISRETGIDLDNEGYYFQSNQLVEIEQQMVECSKVTVADLKEKSSQSYQRVVQRHDLKVFSADFQRSVKMIVRC